jgi:hypothetical protein
MRNCEKFGLFENQTLPSPYKRKKTYLGLNNFENTDGEIEIDMRDYQGI